MFCFVHVNSNYSLKKSLCLFSDYFWDQTYTLVEMGGMEVRETGDEKLPEHQLPKVIEGLIEQGKYDNMQRKIAQVCST